MSRNKSAAFSGMMSKRAFLAWGGGKAGLYPKNFGVGGELGYTNLMGLIPFPTAGIDIGGPRYGFNAGITSDPGSDYGVSPYLGIRLGHPRVSGLTRNFPRGLPDIIYDKARGRTRDEAFRASYPEDKFPEYYAAPEPEPEPEDKAPEASEAGHKKTEKKSASFLEKWAALDPAIANAIGVGGAGAAFGGFLGAINGLGDPGYDDNEEVSEDGIVTTRRTPRSAWGQGLSRSLSGAIIGGAGGALVGGLGTEAMRLTPNLKNWILRQNARNAEPGVLSALNAAAVNAGTGASDYLWSLLPRGAQHEIMAIDSPGIYNNPFSSGANSVVNHIKGYLSKQSSWLYKQAGIATHGLIGTGIGGLAGAALGGIWGATQHDANNLGSPTRTTFSPIQSAMYNERLRKIIRDRVEAYYANPDRKGTSFSIGLDDLRNDSPEAEQFVTDYQDVQSGPSGTLYTEKPGTPFASHVFKRMLEGAVPGALAGAGFGTIAGVRDAYRTPKQASWLRG